MSAGDRSKIAQFIVITAAFSAGAGVAFSAGDWGVGIFETALSVFFGFGTFVLATVPGDPA